MRTTNVTVATVLLWLVVSQPTFGNDATAGAFNQYYDLPQYYGSVSFDVGPRLTFESPDASRYRDLIVASHDGKVRIGTLNDYGPSYAATPDSNARQAKVQIFKRLNEELRTYLGMLALRYAKDYFDDAYFLERDPSRRQPYKMINGLAPLGYMGVLAGNLFQEGPYKTYFCGEQAGCGDPQYRTFNNLVGTAQLVGAKRWGGGQDEFAAMEAIESFLSKDRDAILVWAESLPLEVAAVAMMDLPEYDFSHNGFPLQLTPPNNASKRNSNPRYTYYEGPDSAIRAVDQNQTAHAVLQLEPAVAEALLTEQNARYRRPRVFVVFHGKIHGTYSSYPEIRRADDLVPVYELTSPNVEFFKDAELTEKIGEAALSATPL